MPTNPTDSVIINRVHNSITKKDIYNKLLTFGPICYVDISPPNCRAFVDFADVESASRCVKVARTEHLTICGRQVFVDFSDRYLNNRKHTCSVLSMAIKNVKYDIDVNVVNEICKDYGKVLKIAIFRNEDAHVFVEFKNSNDAENAYRGLDDCDIYENCCSIYAKLTKSKHVSIFRIDDYNYDGETDEMEDHAKVVKEARPRYSSYEQRPAKVSRFDNGDSKQFHYEQGDPYAPNSYESFPPQNFNPNQQFKSWNEEGQRERSFETVIKGNVLSAYGFDTSVWNPHKIFNILCCYGNVVRIKFLLFKSDCTLIEMADNASAVRVAQKLHGLVMFGRPLMFSNFRQSYIETVARPFNLPDGTEAFMDFSSDRNNRFSTQALASKNKMTSPDRSLHFFSGPPHYSEEDINKIFVDCGATLPSRTRVFPSKDNNANSNGIVEFGDITQAAEALALTNHYSISHPSARFNYIFKLCFSTTTIV